MGRGVVNSSQVQGKQWSPILWFSWAAHLFHPPMIKAGSLPCQASQRVAGLGARGLLERGQVADELDFLAM